MDQEYWLRSEWVSMLSKAMSYPLEPTLESEHDYKRYFTDLQFVLPGKFKAQYQKYIRAIPINPFLNDGRPSLALWVVKIHNLHQQATGGKVLTLRQAVEKYL